ncbi:MAG: rod shape-determining protein MreC [bacterium]
MNFHPKNKNFLFKKNIFLLTIIVFFLIIIFSLSWTRNILFSIGSPLWIIKNNFISFFSDNIEVLNSKTKLLKENDLLKKQIKTNEKNQVLFNLLKNENEDLKKILNIKDTNKNLLLSAVLVKPFLSPYDTLIIDVGLLNGVKINDKVLVDGNIFIGYISEVYKRTSKVILYSSPGEKVKILIGDNNIEKEAIGLGGNNFKVEVPREIEIKEGDSIIMPSVSTNIFGMVEKIEFKESDSFQKILFKNPVNIAELKWVEVLMME